MFFGCFFGSFLVFRGCFFFSFLLVLCFFVGDFCFGGVVWLLFDCSLVVCVFFCNFGGSCLFVYCFGVVRFSFGFFVFCCVCFLGVVSFGFFFVGLCLGVFCCFGC